MTQTEEELHLSLIGYWYGWRLNS